ncbi:hypothetical protein HK104_000842 [Borealophlyctis nickersoniae]|nr:hypothetical protein HK104_000842 [Borealophlyctis nickersoniae]
MSWDEPSAPATDSWNSSAPAGGNDWQAVANGGGETEDWQVAYYQRNENLARALVQSHSASALVPMLVVIQASAAAAAAADAVVASTVAKTATRVASVLNRGKWYGDVYLAFTSSTSRGSFFELRSAAIAIKKDTNLVNVPNPASRRKAKTASSVGGEARLLVGSETEWNLYSPISFSAEHYSKDCPGRVEDPLGVKAPPEELERLWNLVIAADKSGDFDDIKDAIMEYVHNDPDETWVGLETKLRAAGLKTHIYAEARILPPQKEFADIAGKGNKRYEIVFMRNPRVIKLKLKNDDDKAQNLERLKDAGVLRDRRRVNGKYELPVWATEGLTQEQINAAKGACVRCGAEDHRAKDCTMERENPNAHVGKCFKCGETGHSFRVCPNPDERRMVSFSRTLYELFEKAFTIHSFFLISKRVVVDVGKKAIGYVL